MPQRHGFIAADQLEARRIGRRGSWRGRSCVSPLSSGWRSEIEHLRRELRQLVEEQHAVMGERNLAGPHAMPPPTIAAIEAEWCGARNGRRAVSGPSASAPAIEAIIETSSSSLGESGGRIDGSRLREHRLAGAGRPDHQQVVAAAAATSSARLALSWPLMSVRSGRRAARSRTSRLGPRSAPACRGNGWRWRSGSAARGSPSRRWPRRPPGRTAAGQIRPWPVALARDGGGQHARDAVRSCRRAPVRPAPTKPFERVAGGIAPIAAIRPSAIGRS